MATTILSGGDGHLPYGGKILINISDCSFEVHYGYSTVANGYASQIDCPAGGYAINLDGGSSRDFASWLIADDFSEIEKHMQKYAKQFHLPCILFAGSERPERIGFSRLALENLHIANEHNHVAIVRQAIKLYEDGVLA